MSIFTITKNQAGYLQPTIEGPATTEELDNLRRDHEEQRQRKVNGHIARLQDERHTNEDLIRRHAEALVEIERLKRALERTGGGLFEMAFVGQQIGEQNQVRSVKVKQANKKNEATNAAKERCKQMLRDYQSIHIGRSNTNAASLLAKRGAFTVNDKDNEDADGRKDKPAGSFTIKQMAALIGEWKRNGEI